MPLGLSSNHCHDDVDDDNDDYADDENPKPNFDCIAQLRHQKNGEIRPKFPKDKRGCIDGESPICEKSRLFLVGVLKCLLTIIMIRMIMKNVRMKGGCFCISIFLSRTIFLSADLPMQRSNHCKKLPLPLKDVSIGMFDNN